MPRIEFLTLGNEFAKRALSNVILKEAYAPFYLLEGPEGVGKASLAHEAVAAALCENQDTRPCRACAVCSRVMSFGHPDFTVLLPEKSSPKPSRPHIRPGDFSRNQRITISQVRSLQNEVMKPPMEGPRRFVVILDGDLMTPEAQNAFLKTLEEPSEKTVFLMVSPAPRRLPFTILSRARRIRFYNLSLEDFSKYDFGDLPLPLPVLHRLSEGSIGKAQRLLGPELQRLRKQGARLLMGENKEMASVISYVGRNRDSAGAFLRVYYSLLRDAMVVQKGAPEIIVNLDMKKEIEEIARRWPGSRIDALLGAAREAEEAILERYISPESALLASFRELVPGSYKDIVR